MKENLKGSHTRSRLTAHIVWVTKYRYHVLQGDIKIRCRDLLIQICDAEDFSTLKGVVSKNHVHMHIEYSPKIALAYLLKRLKGRSSRCDTSGFKSSISSGDKLKYSKKPETARSLSRVMSPARRKFWRVVAIA